MSATVMRPGGSNGIVSDAILSKVFGSGKDTISVSAAALGARPLFAMPLAPALAGAAESASNWVDYAKALEDEDDQAASTASSPSESFNLDSPSPFLDARDRSALSSTHPLSDKVDYAICNYCAKPFLKHVLARHIRECMPSGGGGSPPFAERKRVSLLDADAAVREHKNGEGSGGRGADRDGGADKPKGKAGRAAANGGGGGGGGADDKDGKDGKDRKDKDGKVPKEKKTTKKRKNEAAENKAAKKKKKQSPKATPKPKGPVDVERQCGVPLPNGGFCARSLTCKSHSMGAKRNVPGRSQPYDVLLAAYQKKNQIKQAALTSSAQLAEDMELGNGPIDSDEEVRSVMEGVHRSYAVPLERKVVMPVRVKHQFFRMREMFAGAFARQL
ncbi:Sgf73p [Dipodascopsis tothii]|uniref:Sgf73p n=1 Tax=Dipodascopsis tothii TaxID=44089 RepID=UPI0034CD4A73